MGSTRRHQRDLFEPAARVADLRPELRTKLTPLLRALLTEAAGMVSHPTASHDLSREEGSDDQNRG